MPEDKEIFLKNLNLNVYSVLGRPFLHTLLDPQHQVNEPVDLNHPALFPADLDLVQQVALSLVLAAADGQRLANVLDVLLTGQLGHACHRAENESVIFHVLSFIIY